MAPDVDELVGSWLTLPEVAQRVGVSVAQLRSMLRAGQLLAVRRGDPPVPCVPAEFVTGETLLKGLAGTLTVLRDSGYDDDEALRWLFTADDSLPGTPVRALRENRGTEVRRRAQALAL